MLDEFIGLLKDFKKDGYKTLYAILFDSKQYPYWLFLQIIWSCYIVQKSTKRQKRSVSLWIQNLLESAVITFLPREIFAYLFHQHSPIVDHKLSILFFILIYFLISLSPWDIVFHILDLFSYFLEFFQGLNQARLLIRLLSYIRQFSSLAKILISLLFLNMDQILEICIRHIFNGYETKFSNPLTIIQTIIVSLIFYISVYQNILTKYIGKHNIYIGSLMYAFTLGVLNSIPAINIGNDDNYPIIPPTPVRRSAPSSASVSDSEYD